MRIHQCNETKRLNEKPETVSLDAEQGPAACCLEEMWHIVNTVPG